MSQKAGKLRPPVSVTELPEAPPFFAEIRQALWLSGEDFNQYQWRFPEQMDWLKQHLE